MNKKGATFIVIAACLWGTAGFFVRSLTSLGITAMQTVFLRVSIAFIMLGAIIVLREILFFFINKDIKEHNSSHTKDSHSNKLTAIKFERD